MIPIRTICIRFSFRDILHYVLIDYVNRTEFGFTLLIKERILYMSTKSDRYYSFRFSELSALYGWDLEIGAYKLGMNSIFRGFVQ